MYIRAQRCGGMSDADAARSGHYPVARTGPRPVGRSPFRPTQLHCRQNEHHVKWGAAAPCSARADAPGGPLLAVRGALARKLELTLAGPVAPFALARILLRRFARRSLLRGQRESPRLE